MSEVLPYVPPTLAERSNGVAREWVALMAPAVELARIVADTEFVPRGLRGRPDAVVAAILYGDSLGLDPMQSLAKVAMIDGRPSVSAEGVRGAILARGHRIWVVESTNTRAVVAGQRQGDDRTHEASWTMDDAKRAGLATKTNWRSYPRQMLVARATADLARIAFADVLGGFPVTEETYDENEAGPTPTAPEPRTTRRRRRSPEAADTPPPSAEPPPASAAPSSATVSGAPEPDPGEQSRSTSTADEDEALLAAEREAAEAADEAKLRADLEGSAHAASEAEGDPEADHEIAAMAAEDAAAENERRTLAELAEIGATEVETMTDPQRRKMNALFRERGVSSRDARLTYCATVVGHAVETSSALTIDEAGAVIDALEQWNPEDPASKPFPNEPNPEAPYDPASAPFPEGY